MITRMDRHVGQIVDELHRLGLAEETILVNRLPRRGELTLVGSAQRSPSPTLNIFGATCQLNETWPGRVATNSGCATGP
jgi:hypothetical protein